VQSSLSPEPFCPTGESARFARRAPVPSTRDEPAIACATSLIVRDKFDFVRRIKRVAGSRRARKNNSVSLLRKS
jgi:hypothetical protein